MRAAILNLALTSLKRESRPIGKNISQIFPLTPGASRDAVFLKVAVTGTCRSIDMAIGCFRRHSVSKDESLDVSLNSGP